MTHFDPSKTSHEAFQKAQAQLHALLQKRSVVASEAVESMLKHPLSPEQLRQQVAECWANRGMRYNGKRAA